MKNGYFQFGPSSVTEACSGLKENNCSHMFIALVQNTFSRSGRVYYCWCYFYEAWRQYFIWSLLSLPFASRHTFMKEKRFFQLWDIPHLLHKDTVRLRACTRLWLDFSRIFRKVICDIPEYKKENCEPREVALS